MQQINTITIKTASINKAKSDERLIKAVLFLLKWLILAICLHRQLSNIASNGILMPLGAISKQKYRRKKMKNYGNLDNKDLLGLLINENSNSRTITELMNKFDDIHDLILRASEEELAAVYGFGPKRIAQIYVIRELLRRIYKVPEEKPYKISCPADVYNLMAPSMRFEQVEHFKIIILDTKNNVRSIEHISTGSLNSSIVTPRETFKPAIRKSASSIVLCHNHPSGESEPSHEDIVLTNRLDECSKILGVKVLDHIIIGDHYYSFKEEGLL
jgi:DNA repair protein RadC